jgi:hypothetical protein
MSSLHNANPQQSNTMQASPVVINWTHEQMVMQLNPGWVRIFLLFHAATMLLFYTGQRITET